MKNGDKYASAKALSKLFEEFLARQGGDKEAAKKDMDDELGPAWQVEIEIDDQGIDVIPEDVILTPGGKPSSKEKDEMYKNARKVAQDMSMPSDDLENEGSDRHEDEPSGGSELMCVLKKLLETLSS